MRVTEHIRPSISTYLPTYVYIYHLSLSSISLSFIYIHLSINLYKISFRGLGSSVLPWVNTKPLRTKNYRYSKELPGHHDHGWCNWFFSSRQRITGMSGSFKVFALFWHNCCGSEQYTFIFPLPGQNATATPQQRCLQCLRNFELRAERLAPADMTAVLWGHSLDTGEVEAFHSCQPLFAQASFARHYVLISFCCS